MTQAQHNHIAQQIDHWLYNVVIGLNLCPFALKPYKNKQIRTVIAECRDDIPLLEQIYKECDTLLANKASSLETTLIVTPNMLGDFDDYNQFLDHADALIDNNGWTGILQIASFHPHYQFAGTLPEDAENLTNRSPYPIFHLLREESLEKAISRYPNPEQIPDKNIETVEALSQTQINTLFAYLKT